MTKRRGPNEGSIYQLKDGRWAGALSLGFDARGQRKRKVYYGRTQRVAREQLEAAKSEAQRGLPVAAASTTLAAHLEDWFQHGRDVKDWTPATALGYRSILDTHLIPALGRHRLRKLTPRHVQSLLNELMAGGRDPQTVKNVRAALRSALSLAMKWELVSRNVAALTDAPRIERSEIVPLNPDEAHTFLAAVAGHRLAPLFTVTTALGLRQSEVGPGMERRGPRRASHGGAPANVPQGRRVAHGTHEVRQGTDDPIPARDHRGSAPAAHRSTGGPPACRPGVGGLRARLHEHDGRSALRPVRHEADAGSHA